MDTYETLVGTARASWQAGRRPDQGRAESELAGPRAQLSVRLPVVLRGAVARAASEQGLSLTSFVVEALAKAVKGHDDPFSALALDMVSHARAILAEAVDSGAYARAVDELERAGGSKLIVVDDHYLASRLAGGRLEDVHGQVACTCSWWWRLASALAADRSGSLSSYLARLGETGQAILLRTIIDLPARVTILELRSLLPAMVALVAERPERHLNLLAAEAIVAAEVLGAGLVLAVDTPKIREVAAERGLPYRLA